MLVQRLHEVYITVVLIFALILHFLLYLSSYVAFERKGASFCKSLKLSAPFCATARQPLVPNVATIPKTISAHAKFPLTSP